MEIKHNVSQYNSARQPHGYWEQYYDNKTLFFKCHLFKDVKIGYQERYDIKKFASMSGQTIIGIISCRIHWINSKRIGCLQYHKSQCFYNKLGKTFGEQITWK